MKIFTTMLCGAALLGATGASAQTLYDDFESNRRVAYSNVSGTLEPVNNPGSGGTNTSAKVGKYDRDANQYAVINIAPTTGRMADVSAYTAGTKRITMKFRSAAPAGTRIEIVLQNKARATKTPYEYPQGDFAGTFSAVTTAAPNTWETLTFTFAARGADTNVTATDIDQIAMLVAPNTTTPGTYYIDDLMGPEFMTGTGPVTQPNAPTPVVLDNFESIRLVDYVNTQGTLTAVANPGSSTANNSATVASFVRDGSQYATITIAPKNGKFADVSGYTSAGATSRITMKFRSAAPVGTEVQLVLQNKARATKTPYEYPQGDFAGTFSARTTVVNAWETLTFTFAARGADNNVTATDIDQIAMLIAPNSTSTATYYFDELTGPALLNGTGTRAVKTATAAFAPIFPNPASGLTKLPYSLQKSAVVSLAVFDNTGRRVAQVLNNQRQSAGSFSADLQTSRLAPGLYTCRLVVDGEVLSRQVSVQ